MVVKIVYSDYFHNVNYFGETGKYANIWTRISSREIHFAPKEYSVFKLPPPTGACNIDVTSVRNALANELYSAKPIRGQRRERQLI